MSAPDIRAPRARPADDDTPFYPKPPRQRSPRGAKGLSPRYPLGRRVDVRRRGRFSRLPPPVNPSAALAALAELMHFGDFFQVGRTHYLVAPITDDLLAALIVAAGAFEDDEPSLAGARDGLPGGECDGLEDEFGGELRGSEAALGWANEGSQLSLGVPQADEAESSLGWSNTGPQLRLAAGYSGGTIRESDGDCDAEDDDPPGGAIDDEPHDAEGSL